MNVQVTAEKDVLREAAEILLQNMTPSKAARFWASWQASHGNYLEWKEAEFANETVATLYEKVVQYQSQTEETS